MAAEALSRQGGGGGRSDRRVTIAQIKEEGLGFGEKPDWVQVRVQVGKVRLCWQCLLSHHAPCVNFGRKCC